jgi:hypothetical protein
MPLPQRCKLQYSLPLTIVVIVVNAIKAAILCYMALTTTEFPMLTTGDAVVSFLQQPDRHTMGRCLMSGMETRQIHSGYTVSGQRDWPVAYENNRKKWYSAVSRAKWALVAIL